MEIKSYLKKAKTLHRSRQEFEEWYLNHYTDNPDIIVVNLEFDGERYIKLYNNNCEYYDFKQRGFKYECLVAESSWVAWNAREFEISSLKYDILENS